MQLPALVEELVHSSDTLRLLPCRHAALRTVAGGVHPYIGGTLWVVTHRCDDARQHDAIESNLLARERSSLKLGPSTQRKLARGSPDLEIQDGQGVELTDMAKPANDLRQRMGDLGVGVS